MRTQSKKAERRAWAQPAYSYVPGPSVRILESRIKVLLQVASNHDTAVPVILNKKLSPPEKAQMQHRLLVQHLQEQGVPMPAGSEEEAADPVKLLDLPTEILWEIMTYVHLTDRPVLEIRDAKKTFRMKHRNQQGHTASRELFLSFVRTVFQATTFEYDLSAYRSMPRIDEAKIPAPLEHSLESQMYLKWLRHLRLVLYIGNFRSGRFSNIGNSIASVQDDLHSAKSTFPKLQTLHVSFDFRHGQPGFALRSQSLPTASVVTAGMISIIRFIRSMNLVEATIAIHGSTASEVVDFRELPVEKAVKWICRYEKEDRVFRI